MTRRLCGDACGRADWEGKADRGGGGGHWANLIERVPPMLDWMSPWQRNTFPYRYIHDIYIKDAWLLYRRQACLCVYVYRKDSSMEYIERREILLAQSSLYIFLGGPIGAREPILYYRHYLVGGVSFVLRLLFVWHLNTIRRVTTLHSPDRRDRHDQYPIRH